MTEASAPAGSPWADAALAAALFAIDPIGLGGVVIRCGPGPGRDRWWAALRALLPEAPIRRVPLNIEDERLLGGLDLAASLAVGRPVVQRGVLAECDGGVALLAMAERIEAATAARLGAVLDRGEVAVERDGLAARLPARIGLVAFDEGLGPEERPPEPLLERLAFHLILEGLAERDLADGPYAATAIATARQRLAQVGPAEDSVIEGLCAVAQLLGVSSARAAILALRAARAHAALRAGRSIAAEDAAVAARLVLAPRALTAPGETAAQPAEDRSAPPPEPPADRPDEAAADRDGPSETQMVVDAVRAALPEDLLERAAVAIAARARVAGSRGSGAPAKAARRGRPVGSRPGALRPGDRLNIVETLRAATPWQILRGGGPGAGRIEVRRQDFRIRRFVRDQEATTIFVVDASGSAALARLAEAKGAVELLLARAYVTRSRVALIAFRGLGAELLLPATRSLTRAKRRLADLAGGGGTPLAAGMDAALGLAQAEKARQRRPLLVLLTDGRANIASDGAPGRAAAIADALASSRRLREAGIGAIFVDTSPRPRPDGDRFALAMGAVYAPLPYVDAHAMVGLLGDLQSAGRR